MLYSVFVRRLKPGKTYDDFRRAWYPDQGFGVPVTVVNAARIDDPSEILSIGMLDVDVDDAADLAAMTEHVAAQEAVRHERIAEVIESTELRAVYVHLESCDFTTTEGLEHIDRDAPTPRDGGTA